MTQYGKKILYLAAAILLSLPVVSCRSTKSNTHTYRPYSERRNRGTEPSDNHPGSNNDNGKKPIPGGNGLVSDEWARLDVKLGRHDNKKLYKELKKWLGTPYAYAAHTCGEGTDCSGMVMEVYQEVYGIKVHRNSAKMLEENCRIIDLDDLKEGDLVFFITSPLSCSVFSGMMTLISGSAGDAPGLASSEAKTVVAEANVKKADNSTVITLNFLLNSITIFPFLFFYYFCRLK